MDYKILYTDCQKYKEQSPSPKTADSGSETHQIKTAISDSSTVHGIPASYLTTMAFIESAFNPKATNKSGAAGLFQFMPTTATEMGLTQEERFDIKKATDAAARYT